MNDPFRSATTPEKLRLRVEDFLLLDESGAFEGYAKAELLDGDIFIVNAQHSRHSQIKSLLLTDLNIALRRLGSTLQAWAEPATRFSDESIAEPDIVLTSYRGQGLLPPQSVALVVEVSDTSLSIDLGRKIGIYASAGVPEYWVVDLPARTIHQMWSPAEGSYRQQRQTALGEPIEAATIAGLRVGTDHT